MSVDKTLVIGIASSGRGVPLQLAVGLATQTYPNNMRIGWSIFARGDIAYARQQIAERALTNGAEYLWFVDDDTVPPPEAARKLLYAIEQARFRDSSVMAASGIYVRKADPPEPLVFQGPNQGPFWKWKAGEIFDCWGVGAGCLLIRTEVFARLEKPWFKFTLEVGHSEGEDLYFCGKFRSAGFRLLAHGGVLCEHWDMAERKAYRLPKDSYPMLPHDTDPQSM